MQVILYEWKEKQSKKASIEWVNGNLQSMSVLRMMNGDGKRFNGAIVWCFYSHFTFLEHFWLVICKSDPRWLFAKWSSFTLPLGTWYFTSPIPNFCLIRAVCFISRSMSWRQRAPNEWCALNNDVRLLTRLYGIEVCKQRNHTSSLKDVGAHIVPYIFYLKVH